MASSVEFGPIRDGSFLVLVSWTNRDGSLGSHKKWYFAGNVFVVNGQFGLKLKRSVCRTADGLIQEVQKSRMWG